MEFEEKLEDELTALITAVLDADDALAAPLPDDIAQFFAVQEKSRVWVGYQSSDYAEHMSDITGVVQDDSVLVIVTLQARTRRGDKGIYALRKLVHQALIGYRPENCTRKLYNCYFGPPKTEGVPLLSNQQWTYEYHIKTERVHVQALPEDDNILTNYQTQSAATDLTMPAPQIPVPTSEAALINVNNLQT